MHPARARTPQASWLAVEHDSRRAHDNLESRVRERTAELTKINGQLQAYISEREHLRKSCIAAKSASGCWLRVLPGFCHLHAGSRRDGGELERWRYAHKGIRGQRNHRKALFMFLYGGRPGGLPTRPGPEKCGRKGAH